MIPIYLSVKKLKEYCNPYQFFKFDKKEIQRRVQAKDFYDINDESRIAYFIVNGFKVPIEIDVGIPILNFYPKWLITDGNHRFAAAIWLKQKYILTNISGQNNYANDLFNINLPI